MLARLELSNEELTLAQEMASRLPPSSRLVGACALISAYIARPDTDWPDGLNRVSDSDVEEVLSLLNGQALDLSSLNLEDQLYLPEPVRPPFDYDEDGISHDIWKSGNIAIKRVRLGCASVRELVVMCSLKHPHILSASGFYFEDGDIYICMPLQEGGDLSDLIYSKHTTSVSLAHREEVWEEGRRSPLWVVPLQERRGLARELLQGLSYLHSQRVVHGDIKPQNLFLDRDRTLRVADFGECITYAVPLREEGTSSLRSYERYTRWEEGRGYRDPNVSTLRYSFEADVWAAAITLLEMETGILPEVWSDGVNLGALGTDVEFVTLIEMMIEEPLERVTAEQALVLLR